MQIFVKHCLNVVSMSLVFPLVSCADVAGEAEAVGPDHCRVPKEPAAQKRRVTPPACAVSSFYSVSVLYSNSRWCSGLTEEHGRG